MQENDIMRNHSGHRNRLREKALKGACETHEKLELLLFSVLPRVNTNEIAHDLLDTACGIDGVFSMDYEDLIKIDGIGRAAATQIRNTAEIIRDYQLSLCRPNEILRSEVELCKYLCAIFACMPSEQVCIIPFDKRGNCLGYKIIAEGTDTKADFTASAVLSYMQKIDSTSFIMAHNHADGMAAASAEDRNTAYKFNGVCTKFGLKCLAYYVIASGRCVEYTAEKMF